MHDLQDVLRLLEVLEARTVPLKSANFHVDAELSNLACHCGDTSFGAAEPTFPNAASSGALLSRSPAAQAPPCTSISAGNGPFPRGW